ncbi:ribosomal-processing cysteine protease Prp [Salimicrobium sp. PL1-032A]|uniref:ribosomal-processing cysteine protease Prp n=1 Tax=Salimicrobium sp. PL1-032A TaxID=3095364 RepID=UPI00326014D4
MIIAEFFSSEDRILGFELSGHAESGPYGQDLVCAAVSAVTFGATNALMEVADCNPEIDQEGEGGYLKVILTGEDRAKEQAQTLLEGLLTSLRTIEHENSHYITIKT